MKPPQPNEPRIELPWPPKELGPNARVHYHAKASAAKHYRESAHWLTVASRVERPDACEATLRIDFHPPDNRRRDLDNMLASIKSGLDGEADALEVNDHIFRFDIGRAPPVKNGKVVISLGAA